MERIHECAGTARQRLECEELAPAFPSRQSGSKLTALHTLRAVSGSSVGSLFMGSRASVMIARR
jgi:hypothetical protein